MKIVDKSQSQIEVVTLIWRQYYCVVIESNAFVAETEYDRDRLNNRPSDQAYTHTHTNSTKSKRNSKGGMHEYQPIT